jgi:hypothetical protein
MPSLHELILNGLNEQLEPFLINHEGLDFEVLSNIGGIPVVRIRNAEGWAEFQLHPDEAGISLCFHGRFVVEKFDRNEIDERAD